MIFLIVIIIVVGLLILFFLRIPLINVKYDKYGQDVSLWTNEQLEDALQEIKDEIEDVEVDFHAKTPRGGFYSQYGGDRAYEYAFNKTEYDLKVQKLREDRDRIKKEIRKRQTAGDNYWTNKNLPI